MSVEFMDTSPKQFFGNHRADGLFSTTIIESVAKANENAGFDRA